MSVLEIVLVDPRQWILMTFSATFNNISVISCRSVLLVVETAGPGENHRPVASHWQTFELTTSVVIGTDCIGSCKSNYHMITATTAPSIKGKSVKVAAKVYKMYVWKNDYLSFKCLSDHGNKFLPQLTIICNKEHLLLASTASKVHDFEWDGSGRYTGMYETVNHCSASACLTLTSNLCRHRR